MEQQTSTLNTISFSWDKAHNDIQLSNIEDEFYFTFRGGPLLANLGFRRNPKPHIDEIILVISKMEQQKALKLCEFPCNPGQLRTMSFIVEEVRKTLALP